MLPTFVTGLRTWHVTRPQQALLDRLRDAPAASGSLSVPFDQDYRFLAAGLLPGDMSTISATTAPCSLGGRMSPIGGWNQRSANFAAYEATLCWTRVTRPSLAMLASVGVSRVVSFNYPLIAPQLLTPVSVTIPSSAPSRGPQA